MATNLSWGQIRLLVQQMVKGKSLDEIDHAIQSAYSLILSQMEWSEIEATGQLQTSTAYNLGSITLTPGSTLVTGVGTAWTAAQSGWRLFFGMPGDPYVVTITSRTTLQLDRPYDPYSGSLSAVIPTSYWLAQLVYALPDNLRSLTIIANPFNGLALTEMDPVDFAALEGVIPVSGPATNYIPQPDGVDPQTGETVKQIMLWPVTQFGHSYPITYDQIAEAFDGSSTTDGPLAFVSAAALVARAKYELTGDQTQLALYAEHFRGMIHVENEQRPNQKIRINPRYTRHRIERLMRGLGGGSCFFFQGGDGLDGATGGGAGTPITETPAGLANGVNSLFTLSQIPVSPPVILVSNILQVKAVNYVIGGKSISFLAGSIPAAGASVTAIYTY